MNGVGEPRQYSGHEIQQAKREEEILREEPHQTDCAADKNKSPERLAGAQVDSLWTPEAPSTDHHVRDQQNEDEPQRCLPPAVDRGAVVEVDRRGDHRGSSRNRHANEVLASRTPRVLWLWILSDIEASQTARACNKKQEGSNGSHLNHLASQIRLPKLAKL